MFRRRLILLVAQKNRLGLCVVFGVRRFFCVPRRISPEFMGVFESRRFFWGPETILWALTGGFEPLRFFWVPQKNLMGAHGGLTGFFWVKKILLGPEEFYVGLSFFWPKKILLGAQKNLLGAYGFSSVNNIMGVYGWVPSGCPAGVLRSSSGRPVGVQWAPSGCPGVALRGGQRASGWPYLQFSLSILGGLTNRVAPSAAQPKTALLAVGSKRPPIMSPPHVGKRKRRGPGRLLATLGGAIR